MGDRVVTAFKVRMSTKRINRKNIVQLLIASSIMVILFYWAFFSCYSFWEQKKGRKRNSCYMKLFCPLLCERLHVLLRSHSTIRYSLFKVKLRKVIKVYTTVSNTENVIDINFLSRFALNSELCVRMQLVSRLAFIYYPACGCEPNFAPAFQNWICVCRLRIYVSKK